MMETTQLDGQQQQSSHSQNGHPNGHAISQQKPSHDGLGVLVATKDDEEQFSLKSPTHHLNSSSSSSSESTFSLNGENKGFINGSQHPPTSNMQPVDVDGPGLTTASNSISDTLVSSSTTFSPTTPTPTSVSLMFQRLHQLDAASGQTSLEAPLLESINKPKQSDSVDGDGNQLGAKIIIPEPSTLVSSNLNSNRLSSSISSSSPYFTPTHSRPTSVILDTALFSNRPAPPSPALSRRVSAAPSTASSTHSSNSRPRSRSSITRRPSMGTSRASSKRMSGVGSDAKRQSLGLQLNQFENSTTSTASSLPFGSLNKLAFIPSTQQEATSSTTTTASTTIPNLSDSATSDPIHTTSVTPSATPTVSSLPQPSSDSIPSTSITPSATPTISSLPQPSSIIPPAIARIYIKVKDFGFPPTDERHLGLGADIPKANRVNRLNRKLGAPDRATARAAAAALDPSSSAMGNGSSRRTDSIGSMGSVDSSDADAEEEDEDGKDGSEGWGIGFGGWGKGGSKGWDGFKLGMGRFSWNIRSNVDDKKDKDKNSKGTSSTTTGMNGIFPSRKDLDMNFMDSSSSSDDDDDDDGRRRAGRRIADQGIKEEFDFDETLDDTVDREEDGEYEEPQEPLYPGVYRALYAFEPEGMAEMELEENQLVRVVGRGGGIGWAVVVDERGGDEVGGKVQVKHALVPESYLEAVTLDWEEEEEEFEAAENEDADGAVLKAGDA